MKKIILTFLISNSFLFSQQEMKLEIVKPVVDNMLIINLIGIGEYEDYEFHRVKKGDYLGKIAKDYNKKTKKLVEINELKNPNLIFPKQKIYLNNKKPFNLDEIPDFHIVESGENLIEIASFYELDFRNIMKLNELDSVVLYPKQKLKLKE